MTFSFITAQEIRQVSFLGTIPAYLRPASSYSEIKNRFKLRPYESVLIHSDLNKIDQRHEFAPQQVKDHIATFHENSPHRILLNGPVGTGKSCLAEVIVLRCCLPFIKISGAGLGDSYEGSEKLYIDTLFEVLTKHNSRTALIVDELTALTAKLNGIQEEVESVYYFFEQLERWNQKVVLISTTSSLETVPEYFIKKFRHIYHVDYPSEPFRLAILESSFGFDSNTKNILSELAGKTVGFTIRELLSIYIYAQGYANLREEDNPNNAKITQEDIHQAIKRAMDSHRKKIGNDSDAHDRSYVCTIV